MKKFLTLSLALFSIISASFAQNEENIWYFGAGLGVSFANGEPEPLYNGNTYSNEGSAVISDANGNLLFYTDGIAIFNRLHQQTPNGYGLLGNESSTQSAIIVPKPGAYTRFYIFTTDALESENNNAGLNYTEIDMTLDGGKGDVVPGTKNKLLYKPTAEKLTALRYNNMYWVLSHEAHTNRFCAYKVTSAGVHPTPVISAVGQTYTQAVNVTGYMKFSPDGKHIGVATEIEGGIQTSNGELFTFNPETGVVSNPIPLSMGTSAYGMEFSPDGTRAYFSSDGNIFQFDMTASSDSAIVASQRKIYDALQDTFTVWALQLGPDGKIYTSHFFQKSLGKIVSPNNLGESANFIPGSVSLVAGFSLSIGLPGFARNLSVENPCVGPPLSFLSIFKKRPTCPGCPNGKIVAPAKGGVPPYQYSIDGINYQNNGIFNGLSYGTYTICIRDANGCLTQRIIHLN